MAEKSAREGHQSEDPREGLSTIEAIQKICAHNARAQLDTDHKLLLFLRSWWSRLYNRPLKDPVLLSYSLEELLYEFYDRQERILAENEHINSENDKIEEDKDKAVLDWAEQEEKRELEEEIKRQAAKNLDPTKDAANMAWMKEQLEKAKEIYGETFGEDINESFEE